MQGEFTRASRECVGERDALAEVVVVVEVTGTEVGCEAGESKARGVDCLEDFVWTLGPTPGSWTRGVITQRSAA